ncbi:membrane protein [bacteria symbiont BFo1 of Frankliniella occidentalis]|jgi:hypothetical protein|uniref:DUF3304 domain-containing protein n=1 Tax=Erwinia aphidicola TaxID=68334 RepID=UPI000671F305|nr:membrane protein [bacteria symbiont BFo1 of Frankliniella occidentalis]KYP82505.1 membrane protein [bacteria symbiont BFo1 of Frankliniella occidentalis]
MRLRISSVLCGILLLAGCGQQSAQAEYQGGGGGTIEAINHTKWAISWFRVNGKSGLDIIGPYQGGGGGCCFGVPKQWQPGMTVRVDWKTSVAFASDVPELPEPKNPNLDNLDAKTAHLKAIEYYNARQEWREKVKTLSKEHSLTVPLPDYTGQKTCGITVHFLPCDQVKVTTSCADYGNPRHPIKEPLRMKEPKVCPK